MNITTPPKTHPMVIIAAFSVTILSLVGIASLLGWIPTAYSGHPESAAIATDSTLPTVSSASPAKLEQKAATRATPVASGDSHYTRESNPAKTANAKHSQPAACHNCGVIESIRQIQHEGDGSGLGAVAGGVTGGVIGNQIGNGRGNTLMTILGIGGGAYAGHTIEKKMKATTSYVVKVRMEDGSLRTISQSSLPEYAVGDPVRITNGHLTLA